MHNIVGCWVFVWGQQILTETLTLKHLKVQKNKNVSHYFWKIKN